MTSFKINVKTTQDRLTAIKNKFDSDEVKKILAVITEKIATRSKQLVPVDTGELKDSIHATPPTGKRTIKAKVVAGGGAAPYALIVHERLDLKHKVGQAKYLEQAFIEHEQDFQDAIEKYMRDAFKG